MDLALIYSQSPSVMGGVCKIKLLNSPYHTNIRLLTIPSLYFFFKKYSELR